MVICKTCLSRKLSLNLRRLATQFQHQSLHKQNCSQQFRTVQYFCQMPNRFPTYRIISKNLHNNIHQLRCFVTRPDVESVDSDKNKNKVQNATEMAPPHNSLHEENESGDQYSGHTPVMVEEVLRLLNPANGQTIVDMTFGGGGHASRILETAPDLHYIACDRDPVAHQNAVEMSHNRRKRIRGRVTPVLSCFSEVALHLDKIGVKPGSVDSFFFDLGASSMQFDTPLRGFSLSQDGPLDMRMDGNRIPGSVTAADVVNNLEPHDLALILKKYGEERKAIQIAHAIVEARYAYGKFARTKQLADVVNNVFESSFRRDKLHRQAHVATKTFQALRIFVNDELNEIHNGLRVAQHYLKPGGRCGVLSFHSLEDRIVKRHFHGIDIDEESNLSLHQHFQNASVSFDIDEVRDEFLTKDWQPLSRKVMVPSVEETYQNPRSRSAKLRVAIKSVEKDAK